MSNNSLITCTVRRLTCHVLLLPFAPAAFTAFLATMASADFSAALTAEISPGKARELSARAVGLYTSCLSVTVGLRVS